MTTVTTTRPATAQQPVREPAAFQLARLAADYDGIAFLEAIKNGELPAPPIAELLGFEIRDVRRGEVTFAMTPQQQHYNPIGSVHGGVIATLLDTAMGCALHTRLPRGTAYTTLDISVRYLRAVTVQTHDVLAVGTVVHHGRRTATAEGRLLSAESGQLLGTATSTLLITGGAA